MSFLVARHVVSGRYELVRPLGTGGMGTLWVARDLALGSLAAIKFIAPDVAASEQARARFRREVRAAARIRSPHVVEVFDHGIHDDQPYFVMELLVGEDLSARLRRAG